MGRQTWDYGDLFCGAGGFSQGARDAAEELDIELTGIAVNHWQIAVDTHSLNHPKVKHLCANLDHVDPVALVPGRHLDMLLASPECTHHSRARGGRPMSDQSRASAHVILKWMDEIDISNVLIENVEEFQDWGRLNQKTGRPIQSEKGKLFANFIESIRVRGYKVEWRVLNAADYGGVQTRERLFIQCRKGQRRIVWPVQTHRKDAAKQPGLFGEQKPWRAVKEILELDKKGKSIFTRKKPLVPNSMKRIMRGLYKFNGLSFVMNISHTKGNGGYVYPLGNPITTLTTRQEHMFVEPMLIQIRGGKDGYVRGVPASKPLQTLTTDPATMVVQSELTPIDPFIIGMGGNQGSGHPRSAKSPLGTLTADPHFAVVEGDLHQFILPQQSGGALRGTDAPLNTISGAGAHQLVNIELKDYLVRFNGGKDGDNRSQGIDTPLGTLDTSNRYAKVSPFLIKYYGNEKDGQSIFEPISTITTKERHMLVYPIVQDRNGNLYLIDIRTRMLTVRECARGMGLSDDYTLTGTKKNQIKQVGNMVERNVAKSLIRTILEDELKVKAERRKARAAKEKMAQK